MEHHLLWCPRICVEYICGEEGGNADLTCVLLTSEVQILSLWVCTCTIKIITGRKKRNKTDISLRILTLLGPSLLNALLVSVS